MKISKLEIKRGTRQSKSDSGWTTRQVTFADLIVDGQSLYHTFCERGYDYISCLGWSFIDVQQEEIDKLLLRGKPDFKNGRYAIYICPECADLGCGAVSARIEKKGELIVWKDFGSEGTLETSHTPVRTASRYWPVLFSD